MIATLAFGGMLIAGTMTLTLPAWILGALIGSRPGPARMTPPVETWGRRWMLFITAALAIPFGVFGALSWSPGFLLISVTAYAVATVTAYSMGAAFMSARRPRPLPYGGHREPAAPDGDSA